METSFPESLFVEADGLRDVFQKAGGQMTWPLVGKSGEVAALMNMFSHGQVEFDMDPATFPSLVHCGDNYNTRSLSECLSSSASGRCAVLC